MKAIQVTRFGDPTVLAIAELADPMPGPGELAIDVTHSAVGLIDVFFREGKFRDVPGMAQPPFIPGLEVAGRVRALGSGVSGFTVGESVVSMSAGSGTGGYASVFIAKASHAISLEGTRIDPALAVAMVPNAAMAHIALSQVAHLSHGESVLVHGALGGFAAAFPGIAKQLGASQIVGTVRASRLEAAKNTKLPYDQIVDSSKLPGNLDGQTFDVVIDPVGGLVRNHSLAVMKAGSRLIVAGNASSDWQHTVNTNDLWVRNLTISGFNAGGYLALHPQFIRPALEAALQAVVAGYGEAEIELLPLEEASIAHERMAARELNGRIVLTP